MGRIKNDPSRYVTRTSLVARTPKSGIVVEGTKRERDFLTAPIGDDLYVSFRSVDDGRVQLTPRGPKTRL